MPVEDSRSHPRNLAARAAGWSAKYRKSAIAVWFVFVALAVVTGSQVGQKQLENTESMVGESRSGQQILDESFSAEAATESVVISSERFRAGDPRFDAAVSGVVAAIERSDDVTNIRSPLGGDGPVSGGGHAAMVQFDLKGEAEDAGDLVPPIVESVEAEARDHSEVSIGQFGNASIGHAIDGIVEDDFARAQQVSLPATLLIMLLAFGALVAAGIPVLLAISSVGATIGLVSVVSQLIPVDQAISEVVLLIGMAVGVDYSLFYLKREREERAAGRSERAALEAAAATSGRAVLISGVTVILAMSGMFMVGTPIFTSFAIGTILVVSIAMIGSLTVLPATMSLLGDRINRGRIPFLAKARQRSLERGESGGIWSRIVSVVLKKPLVAMLLSVGVLLAAALPALQMETREAVVEGLPQELPVLTAYKAAQQQFPQQNRGVTVVVKSGDLRAEMPQAAIADLRSALGNDPAFVMPTKADVELNDAGTVASINVPMVNADSEKLAERDLSHLRKNVIPAAFSDLPGTSIYVTGSIASSADFTQQMRDRLPLVFVFVLSLAFVLLLFTFRSVVIPVVSILLNLLSISAAYGVMVLIFQHGWLSGLLGFEGTFAITPWLPMFMFVVLFGLSMDYHVFILSRIREGVQSGLSTETAISEGIRRTAGVVTSAAAVMVAVFAIFGTLSLVMFKQMGVGLAIAILIDATIVRAVLLPAAMKLLGDANWYLPSWLEWLPKRDGLVEQDQTVEGSRSSGGQTSGKLATIENR